MLDEARFLKNELGKTKEAIKLCNRILKIDNNNIDALLIKAGGLKELDNVEEFVALVQDIMKRWPNHWEAYYLLSLFIFGLNEDDKALQLMRHSIKLDENFNNVISYAQMLYLVGDHNYLEYVEKAKKMDKKRADNFMKNIWIWDIESVEPTISETIRAKKIERGYKKMKENEQN